MTILTAHPIKATFHTLMFCANYQTRISIPVIRRIVGVRIAGFAIDILQNNANIIRPDWSMHLNIGRITITVVR